MARKEPYSITRVSQPIYDRVTAIAHNEGVSTTKKIDELLELALNNNHRRYYTWIILPHSKRYPQAEIEAESLAAALGKYIQTHGLSMTQEEIADIYICMKND